jgi:chemotaxis response regulator CheB
MKAPKVLVISFSGLGQVFWKSVIGQGNANVFQWEDYNSALNNLTNVSPDVIIVENNEYEKDSKFCVEYILKFLREVKVFWINQNALAEKHNLHDNRLVNAPLSCELVTQISRCAYPQNN